MSQLSHDTEESSNGTLAISRVPEPPDLADKSSQSSLASLEDAGGTFGGGGGGGDGDAFVFYFHLNIFLPIKMSQVLRIKMY